MPGLTVKQRKFVKHYVETGNGTQAALVAYDTEDARVGHAIAAENLQKPAIQHAVHDLLDATGLSDERLAAIHAHFLALHQSPNPQEKALALRALHMAYQLSGAYAANRHVVFNVNEAIDRMTPTELQSFIDDGTFPERFRPRDRVPGTPLGEESIPTVPIVREHVDEVSIQGMRIAVRIVPRQERS